MTIRAKDKIRQRLLRFALPYLMLAPGLGGCGEPQPKPPVGAVSSESICTVIGLELRERAKLVSSESQNPAYADPSVGPPALVNLRDALLQDRAVALQSLRGLLGFSVPGSADFANQDSLNGATIAACDKHLSQDSEGKICDMTAGLVADLQRRCDSLSIANDAFDSDNMAATDHDFSWLAATRSSRACSDLARTTRVLRAVGELSHRLKPMRPSPSVDCQSLIPTFEAVDQTAAAKWRAEWPDLVRGAVAPLNATARQLAAGLPSTCLPKGFDPTTFCAMTPKPAK